MKTVTDRICEAGFLLLVLAGTIMFFRAGRSSSASRDFDPVLREHFSQAFREGEHITSSHCELIAAGYTEDTDERYVLIDYSFRVRTPGKGAATVQKAVLVSPLDGKRVISDDPYLRNDGEGNLYAWTVVPEEEPKWLDY